MYKMFSLIYFAKCVAANIWRNDGAHLLTKYNDSIEHLTTDLTYHDDFFSTGRSLFLNPG